MSSYFRSARNAALVLVVAAVGLLSGGEAAEAQGVEKTVFEKITGTQLRRMMVDEGYSVEVDEDGDIRWKLDGLKTLILISKNRESIQFHIAFSDGNASLRKVNEWNKSKKFSRTYLDDKEHPHLELDLDLEGGVTEERIQSFLRTCKTSMSVWLDEVVR